MQLGLSFKSNTYKLTVKGPEIWSEIQKTTLKRAFCPVRFQLRLAFVVYTIEFQLLKRPAPAPSTSTTQGV